uniref:RNA-directed DNA polymerase n=1 Tax=Trichuris muris TaxID=70415 RepID=A0A5S6Q225_TRIMR
MDNSTVATVHTTAALAVKLPQFWPHSARLWFAQAEAQFALARITVSMTKFHHAIASLPDSVAAEVEDLLEPYGDAPYEYVKAKLLERFTSTTDERFRSLVDPHPIGDQRPSQILREMRRMAPGMIDPNSPFFRQLFLNRLPPNVQLILKATHPTNIDDLARAADELVVTASSVNAVTNANTPSDPAELQALRQEVAVLRDKLRLLSVSPSRGPVSRRRPDSPLVRPTRSPLSFPLQFPGKLKSRALGAVESSGWSTSRHLFFVRDRLSRLDFLVDTGSEVSVLPSAPHRCGQRQQHHQIFLFAANGTKIATYGDRVTQVDFGLGKPLRWSFLIADVRQPILGADFFRHFNLLVDVKRKQLINAQTYAVSKGTPLRNSAASYTFSLRHANSKSHSILARYPTLTTCTTADEPVRHSVEHRIWTSGPPIFSRPRRLPAEKLMVAKKEFDTMLRLGIIRPSNSSWASPLHMVPKKQAGVWRPCGDYRRLNNVTRPDRYPIPHLNDFAAQLHDQRVFSKIDLIRAYHQIPVHRRDVPKTAVTTPFGLYEYVRMPFGLRNAAQTFQRFMDQVTRGLNFCFVYLDDILVASKTMAEHDAHLAELFQRFVRFGVKINPDKCIFHAADLEFLGYHLSTQGIRPLDEKVATIRNFPRPSTMNELRRFLGCVNFYRRFIPKAAALLAPLERLVSSRSRNAPVELTAQAIKAFDTVKQVLADAVLLSHPAPNAPLSLVVDASDNAAGAVVQQKVDGHWQPLSFFSRRFAPREHKYSAFGRELLAVYWAVRHFRHLLEGRQFAILTDHKPLVQAIQRGSGTHNPREVRQLDYITCFTSDVRHIRGDKNSVADALSRVAVNSISLILDSAPQMGDEELQQLKRNPAVRMERIDVPHMNISVWCDTAHGRIRLYVPGSMRREIFDALHSLSHPSIRGTKRLVSQHYIWPLMNRNVADWTRTCCACQRSKVQRHTKAPPTIFEIPDRRFDHVHLDIVGPLPPSRGNSYLLTMVDRFTRWPEAVPIPNASAPVIARAFVSTWVARFGLPAAVTTDQGRQFQSSLWRELASTFGIKLARTTAYHPQANGLVERLHRQLKCALTAHAQSSRSWVDALPLVLLGIRCSVKEDLQHAPAELVYGSPLRLPGVYFGDTETRNVNEHSDELRAFFSSIQPVPTRGAPASKWFVPKNLETCTHVFLRRDANRPPLSPAYEGPYKVIDRTPKTVTILCQDRPKTVSIDRVKPAFVDAQQRTGRPHVTFNPHVEFIH